ncbi:MAG: hypothetical protein WDN04_00520 [Rhodospirillales bacterium]
MQLTLKGLRAAPALTPPPAAMDLALVSIVLAFLVGGGDDLFRLLLDADPPDPAGTEYFCHPTAGSYFWRCSAATSRRSRAG